MQDRIRATLLLEEPVNRVPGVSSSRTKLFSKLDVRTIRDLLLHFPRRYMDLSAVRTIASARSGEFCTISATIHEVKVKRPRPRLSIVEATVVDDTGTMIVSIFNQPWMKDRLKSGQRVVLAGQVKFDYGFLRMSNPFMEVIEDPSTVVEGRIIPIHPATERLAAGAIRKVIESAIGEIRGLLDPIPVELRQKHGLVSRSSALASIHFPKLMNDVEKSKERLIYEELLLLQLNIMQQAHLRASQRGATSHTIDGPKLNAMLDSIPFDLTPDQSSAMDEILIDMSKPKNVSRMLLGDVGTGKTVVAGVAMAAAVDSDGQAILLAPTEVLATQHANTLGSLFAKSGISSDLLTGSTSSEDRSRILASFATGGIDVLIGTHAILEDDVVGNNVTLVVIDEQQRFGVDQRSKALEKGEAADSLFMTATPIPRTLALAIFGDLELSYLRTKPNVGAMRTTTILPFSKRGDAYDAALAACERGEQVFVVCPLIGVSSDERDAASSKSDAGDEVEESYHPDVSIEDEDDFDHAESTSAIKHAEFLQNTVFKGYTVGLLTGAMPSNEKAMAMKDFLEGKIDVLVCTTVIEVGVDVPNATVMIVEDADRFGLSQLHQLRGRVGRGEKDAQVFLISASKRKEALKRLEALEKSDDGFEIAGYDLSLRREGDILGNRQSGTSALKLVNVMRDSQIIEWAHADARAIIDEDPMLEDQEHLPLAREIRLLFSDRGSIVGG